MAIFHCTIKNFNRSSGLKNVVAAAAYRCGEKLFSNDDNQTKYPHRNKKDIEFSLMLNNPYGSRQKLWNAVEKSENRKNSNLAREVEVALPKELNQQQRQELVKDICQNLVDRYDVAIDANMHREKEGNGNFHAHILITTRKVQNGQLGDKVRILDQKHTGAKEYNYIRNDIYAKCVNDHLQAAGIDQEISGGKTDEELKQIHHGHNKEKKAYNEEIKNILSEKERIEGELKSVMDKIDEHKGVIDNPDELHVNISTSSNSNLVEDFKHKFNEYSDVENYYPEERFNYFLHDFKDYETVSPYYPDELIKQYFEDNGSPEEIVYEFNKDTIEIFKAFSYKYTRNKAVSEIGNLIEDESKSIKHSMSGILSQYCNFDNVINKADIFSEMLRVNYKSKGKSENKDKRLCEVIAEFFNSKHELQNIRPKLSKDQLSKFNDLLLKAENIVNKDHDKVADKLHDDRSNLDERNKDINERIEKVRKDIAGEEARERYQRSAINKISSRIKDARNRISSGIRKLTNEISEGISKLKSRFKFAKPDKEAVRNNVSKNSINIDDTFKTNIVVDDIEMLNTRSNSQFKSGLHYIINKNTKEGMLNIENISIELLKRVNDSESKKIAIMTIKEFVQNDFIDLSELKNSIDDNSSNDLDSIIRDIEGEIEQKPDNTSLNLIDDDIFNVDKDIDRLKNYFESEEISLSDELSNKLDSLDVEDKKPSLFDDDIFDLSSDLDKLNRSNEKEQENEL